MLEPFRRRVLLGQSADFVLVELGPRCSCSGEFQNSSEFAREVIVETIPIQFGLVSFRLRIGPPNRALEKQPMLVSLLRSAGDFLTGAAVDHVEHFGALKTDPRDGRASRRFAFAQL